VRDHAADFSQSDIAHLFFQDPALPAGDHTILAAYTPNGPAHGAQTLLSTNRRFLELAPGKEPVSYPGAPTYQMDGVAVRGFENTAGNFNTSMFRRKVSLLQNIFGHSFDGEPLASTTIEPVLPTIGTTTVGSPFGITGSGSWHTATALAFSNSSTVPCNPHQCSV